MSQEETDYDIEDAACLMSAIWTLHSRGVSSKLELILRPMLKGLSVDSCMTLMSKFSDQPKTFELIMRLRRGKVFDNLTF